MPTYEVRILAEPEYPQWDHFVKQSVQGTVFHSSAWITTTAKMHNVDYAIIGVFNNAEVIGGCSLFIRNIFPGYKIGYTTDNITPYGGCVISNPTSVHVREYETRHHEITSLILEKIETLNLARIHLVNGPGLVDIRPFTQLRWRERVYYTYILSLEEDIFSHISHGARKTINRARKKGITVRKEYNPEIYWKLMRSTYEKQDREVPVQKDCLFSLMEMLHHNNLGEMSIAETSSGEAASAVFNVYDSQTAHGWEGANDPLFKDTGATSLLLFETFEDLKIRGFHHFNLMAANTPHLAQFYSSFNPRLVPYYGVEKTKGLGKLSTLFR